MRSVEPRGLFSILGVSTSVFSSAYYHMLKIGASPSQAGVSSEVSLSPAMSKLYVGNIPDGAKEKDIQELFQAFGEVEEVALLRGYGFVVSVRCAI